MAEIGHSEIRLWNNLAKKIHKAAHVVRVENGQVGPGSPDINICHRGQEIWIECKVAEHNGSVKFQKFQPAWIAKRARAGGNIFILVWLEDLGDILTPHLVLGKHVLDLCTGTHPLDLSVASGDHGVLKHLKIHSQD